VQISLKLALATISLSLISKPQKANPYQVRVNMLYLDGVCAEDNYGKTRFDDEHPCSPPYGQPEVVQPVYLE
jgi:hypothetical protein